MPAYLIETGRSYQNPVDSHEYSRSYTTEDHQAFAQFGPGGYQIKVEGSGPGSYEFGKDEVYYIGTQVETCVANCDAERRPIWRWFSCRRVDHTWHYLKELPDSVPFNPRRYNAEPRNKREVFYLSESSHSGNSELFLLYDPVNFNSYFSTVSGASTVAATFDASGNLVCTGSGTATITFNFSWNDNPSTAGTALGTYAIPSLNISFTQSGRTGTAVPQTATITGGQTYNCTITNGNAAGFTLQDGNTKICFKDGDGSDCNASLTTSILNDPGNSVASLGYIWTSSAAAVSAGVTHPNESLIPLYHYKRLDNPDDFYTTDPANEYNLEMDIPGVPNCKLPLDQDYKYQGILGYVFSRNAPRKKKQVVESGKPINTGEVSRSTWYEWDEDGGYGEEDYNEQSPPASTLGWGNPDNAELIDEKGNFEWYYGKNGAVKAALPRFLGFHDAFEGQFVYYLYDTVFPFSGPIYGINLITTDAPCNPSTADCPHDPHTTYHSYYYEMRQDAWVTQKTHIAVDAPAGSGLQESFWAVGTDDLMVFFRYTNEEGFYTIGETINGWLIQSVRYFGDELRCGYMRLQTIAGAKGNEFQYQQTYNSANGAVASILAGYGIKDKAAFFGVYEFPKKLSYYKVEIDNEAKIPKRDFDEAILEATVNDAGQIGSIEIINGGRDYTDPQVVISIPDLARQEGYSDTASHIPETFEDNVSGEIAISYETNDDFEMAGYDAANVAGNVKNQKYITEAGYTGTIKQAEATVTIDALGCVKTVTILDPGAGYQPGEEVQISVAQRDKKIRSDTYVGEGAKGIEDQLSRSLESDTEGENIPNKEANDAWGEGLGYAKESFKGFNAPIQTEYVSGYIKATDYNADEKVKFCDQIPVACLNPGVGKDWTNLSTYMDPEQYSSQILNADATWGQNDAFISDAVSHSVEDSAYVESKMAAGMPGMFGGECLETFQTNFYQVRRFFDIPCPYVSYDQYGDEKTYGYLPYKYCGSKEEFAQVRVSMWCEGDVSQKGEVINQRFLDWLESLPKPSYTRPRPAGPNDKSHSCTRGSTVKGRCFSSGGGNYTFVPSAGDETTFDFYGTELEKLATWVGPDNYTAYGSGSISIYDTMNGQTYNHTYNTIQLDSCTNNKFPDLCWHNFIADGVLDVYSGYDANGNGLASDDICTGQPFSNPSTWVQSSNLNEYGQCAALQNIVHSTVAFDTGKTTEDNPYIEIGPWNGKMHWANYLPGATNLLEDSIKRWGNPYFDECDLTNQDQ
tara:strand:- start:49522 stop:53283 length:3762 start_codon:yes stop_codon:yes gene_type:complete